MVIERNIRIGLKLWSPNIDLARRADELCQEGWIHYVELYAVPGTYGNTIETWRSLKAPFMIHCPHSAHGFNLAKAELWEKNQEKFREVQRFTDALKAKVIVVHGGNNGRAQEVIRQLKALKDERIFLENKPKLGLNREICIAHSPEELAAIKSGAGLKGFVLDFGHAIYAARASDREPFEYIQEFLQLNPRFFHLGDGDSRSQKDIHLNLGQGNFDIARLVSLVPQGARVSIETPMGPSGSLDNFVKDVSFIRGLENLK